MKQINSIKDTICTVQVRYYQTSPADIKGEYVIKSIAHSSKLVDNETSDNSYSSQNKRFKTQWNTATQLNIYKCKYKEPGAIFNIAILLVLPYSKHS